MMNIHILELLLARERIKEWPTTTAELRITCGNDAPELVKTELEEGSWKLVVGSEWILSAMLDKAQAGRNLVAESFAKMKEDRR